LCDKLMQNALVDLDFILLFALPHLTAHQRLQSIQPRHGAVALRVWFVIVDLRCSLHVFTGGRNHERANVAHNPTCHTPHAVRTRDSALLASCSEFAEPCASVGEQTNAKRSRALPPGSHRRPARSGIRTSSHTLCRRDTCRTRCVLVNPPLVRAPGKPYFASFPAELLVRPEFFAVEI